MYLKIYNYSVSFHFKKYLIYIYIYNIYVIRSLYRSEQDINFDCSDYRGPTVFEFYSSYTNSIKKGGINALVDRG